MEDDIKQRKISKKIIIPVALALIALIIAAVSYFLGAPKRNLLKQLDLGNKYLLEGNYEQARVEFDKAIQIDPMNVEAYVGIADAYVGLTNENTPEDAVVDSTKEEMISNLDVNNLSDGSEEKAKIEDMFAQALKYCDDVLTILNSGYELTNDENIKSKIDEIAKLKEDIETIKNNMISDIMSEIEKEQAAKQELAEFESKLGCKLEDIKVFGLSIYDLADMSPDDLWNYIGDNYSNVLEEADYTKCGYPLGRYKDENSANCALYYCYRNNAYETLGVGVCTAAIWGDGCSISFQLEGPIYEKSKEYISGYNVNNLEKWKDIDAISIPEELLPKNCEAGNIDISDFYVQDMSNKQICIRVQKEY